MVPEGFGTATEFSSRSEQSARLLYFMAGTFFTNAQVDELARQRSEDSRAAEPKDSPNTNKQGTFDEAIGLDRKGFSNG